MNMLPAMIVSAVSHRFKLALALYTLNNSGELVPSSQPRLLLKRDIESLEVSWCQYYASVPLSKHCHSHLQILDMFDERTSQFNAHDIVLIKEILLILAGCVTALSS